MTTRVLPSNNESLLPLMISAEDKNTVILEGIDEDPTDADFMDADSAEIEMEHLRDDIEMSNDFVEDKFDLLTKYDPFGEDGIEDYLKTYYPDYPDSSDNYIPEQKYTRDELFPTSIHNPLPVKESLLNSELTEYPFRFQRSWVIVTHKEFHKDASSEHVFLAQKIYNFFHSIDPGVYRNREKLNEPVDHEPDWTNFLLHQVVQDCESFLFYMLNKK